ncbi:MAG: beta-galactosidase [Anaerolineales bacterium]
MQLGVCYYPEHWPEERWATDARLMREAGLTYVRIGEFAWQLMEPEEGHFEWGWLDRATEALAEEELQVVLGTPTATPPAWLVTQYPDVLPVDAQGRVRRFGSRRHYCPTSPTYRRHTERIVQALAARYGDHPAVVGWQIDNELGCHDTVRCYCNDCTTAFRLWLQARYGSLEALNAAWGTLFWSQVYTDWRQIGPPTLTVTEPNPSHVLDYRRFSSDQTVSYQQLQVNLLRSSVSERQFITHNLMASFTQLDYHDLVRPLDFVCWDSYPTGYAETFAAELYFPEEKRADHAYDTGDPYVTGFGHDLMRGFKQGPFCVMEQQAGQINWGGYNPAIRSGTPQLWTWHAGVSGADVVVYFRWRATRFAQEQFHSGLLHHDGSFDVGYEEVQALQEDLPRLKALSQGQVPVQVALLLDYEDLWALEIQPHRQGFSLLRHLFVFYRALQRLGIPVDIVSPRTDLSRYRMVVAPTLFLADEELAGHLTGYVREGGLLLLGVRSGVKTPTNLVTAAPLPGPFRDLVGATVADWHALPPGVGYKMVTAVPGLKGTAAVWAEALTPVLGAQTQVLATYPAGPFQGRAALVGQRVGRGRAFYLGWCPTPEQAQPLLAYLGGQAGVSRLAEELPEGLVAARRGEQLVLLNFTERTLTAKVEGQALEVLPRDVVTILTNE